MIRYNFKKGLTIEKYLIDNNINQVVKLNHREVYIVERRGRDGRK